MLAGIVGTAGGITSMVSYPALLAIGLPARSANIANVIAVVACWPGSALASRRELRGWGRWLVPTSLAAAAAGGAAGAALLLCTSAAVFRHVVPFLIAGGSLTLAAAPWLTARGADACRAPGQRARIGFGAVLFVLSVYSGYFGAGSGVMILTLVLLRQTPDLPTANALKNMLVGPSVLISAAIYAVAGPADWHRIWPLALGMLGGSLLGPRVTRRVPPGPLRAAIVVLGLGLAVQQGLAA